MPACSKWTVEVGFRVMRLLQIFRDEAVLCLARRQHPETDNAVVVVVIFLCHDAN